MASQSVWYQTRLDEKLIDCLKNQISSEEMNTVEAELISQKSQEKTLRNSLVAWLPTAHWISPLIWFYIERANRENFKFDINCIDGESLQYTTYNPGQYYGWHRDDALFKKRVYIPSTVGQMRHDWGDSSQNECSRKLSFSLILSDTSEYEGGQFQMLSHDNKMYQIPQEKGLLVIFDSTTMHRVRAVKKGIRRSLVGWVLGPRWR